METMNNKDKMEGQKRVPISISILMGVAALVMLGPVEAAESTLWFQGTVRGMAAQAHVEYFTYEHTGSGVEFNGQIQVGPRNYFFNAFGGNGQLYEGGRLIAYIQLQISAQAMAIRLDSGETLYFQRFR